MNLKVLGGLIIVAVWFWAIFQICDSLSDLTFSLWRRISGQKRIVGSEDLRKFLSDTYGDGPWAINWDEDKRAFKVLTTPKEKDNDETNKG